MATSTPGSLTTEVNPEAAQISPLALSDMRIIGETQQQWAPLRRKYNLFLYRPVPGSESRAEALRIPPANQPLSNSQALDLTPTYNQEGEFGQFAYVDERFLSWDFSLLSADGRLIGSVNRNFSGFGREIFTDTGVYALRMDAAGLAQEPRHLISKTGQQEQPDAQSPNVAMTLDQRAVMLATAVSVDFDYFSRHSGSGMGGGFMPLWFPGIDEERRRYFAGSRMLSKPCNLTPKGPNRSSSLPCSLVGLSHGIYTTPPADTAKSCNH